MNILSLSLLLLSSLLSSLSSSLLSSLFYHYYHHHYHYWLEPQEQISTKIKIYKLSFEKMHLSIVCKISDVFAQAVMFERMYFGHCQPYFQFTRICLCEKLCYERGCRLFITYLMHCTHTTCTGISHPKFFSWPLSLRNEIESMFKQHRYIFKTSFPP